MINIIIIVFSGLICFLFSFITQYIRNKKYNKQIDDILKYMDDIENKNEKKK